MKNENDFKHRLNIDRNFLIKTYHKLGLHVPEELDTTEIDQAELAHKMALIIYGFLAYIKSIHAQEIYNTEKAEAFFNEYKNIIKHRKHEEDLEEIYEEHHQEELKHEHDIYEQITNELAKISNEHHPDNKNVTPDELNHIVNDFVALIDSDYKRQKLP